MMTVSGEKEDLIKSNGGSNGTSSGIRNLSPTDYVGFESLPEQYVNRTIREGFVFNVLVLGATGVGKSTLIDSLFNTKFPDVSTKSHNSQTVELHVQTHELQEKQIKLKLTIVESRGFGDQINKGESYKSIVSYIDSQFERYLQEELKIHRSNNLSSQDTRIHCCLYLISPIGHGLRAIDLITLKQLDSKVNIIPIIAKADIITKNELSKLRSKIMAEIITNGIQIYNFPTDDPEIAENNLQTNGILPFAVVASHDFVRLGNKQVRARQYPWGTVQVENENHCDFVKLREMLLRINMEDLRETTQTKHYEVYRRTRLEEMGFGDVVDTAKASTFQETYEARRNIQLTEIKKKEEEIRQRFVCRVREREGQFEQLKNELHTKYDTLKKYHQEEKRRVEEERRRLEEDMQAFNQKKTSVLSATTNINQSTTSLSSTLTLGKSKKK